MNPIPRQLPSVLCILLLAGCATGQQALQKGRYDRATTQAAKHLKSFPNSARAAQTLLAAYPAAQERWLRRAAYAHETSDPFRWEAAVDAYRDLNGLARKIDRSPPASALAFEYRYYHAELAEAKELASAAREAAGDSLLATGNRDDAQAAYFQFEKAQTYTPAKGVIQEKKLQALHAGTRIVALHPVDGDRFGLDSRVLEDRILDRVGERSLGLFTKVVPYDFHGASYNPQPDHILRVTLTRSSIGRMSEHCVFHEHSREIEVGKTKDNPPKPILKTVKATIIETILEKDSYARVEFSVVDLDLDHRVFSSVARGSASWTDSWFELKGDRRAIEGRVGKRHCGMPPSDWDQENQVASQIARNMERQLRRFYRDF